MSYDLIFWCGRPEGDAASVYRRLCRGEAVSGVQELTTEAVIVAFRNEFPDVLEEDGDTLESGFSILLSGHPTRVVAVNCAWGVAKHPEVLSKIEQAGYMRLRCQQIGEFRENPKA
jgi:hypothetical protein